ncbi:MAG TPA: hypothetical protein VFT69_02565 [Pseudolabrys sp.]|jgi:hypothetical protein|nr:hypothetical protein [Pseudolabrys sp.]
MNMQIDWQSVNWAYIVVLAVFVFVSTLLASLVSFRRHMLASLLSAVVFSAIFVFWSYYPHHLPLPTSLNSPGPAVTFAPPPAANSSAVPAAAPTPPAPIKPGNPVTEATPSQSGPQ